MDVRRWCSRSGGTQSGNARSVAAEGAAVAGHGDGDAVSLPLLERQWSSLLHPTESRSSTTLKERERERDIRRKKKKSCGFRGCLLSCPKRENLGRHSAYSANIQHLNKMMKVGINRQGSRQGSQPPFQRRNSARNIYRSSRNSTRIAGRFSLGDKGVAAGGWGLGGGRNKEASAKEKREDSVLDLAVLASGRPSVDSHRKGWAPGLRSH